MNNTRWMVGLVAAMGLVSRAQALTASTTFTVSATVASHCKASAGNLAFGASYAPGAGAATTTSTISVNCTKGTPFTVALGAGASTGATVQNRNMTGTANPAALLNYQLYSDSADTTVWGDGTAGTSASASQSGLGMGGSQAVDLTVYAQIPDSAANQGVPPDTYNDTVQVTVNY